MTDIALKIENLAKKYIISHEGKQGSYKTLRETLSGLFRFKKNTIKEEFWALKDINLEIKKGEKVAIIGRNGAGKSTLLKLLSRITEPTDGKVEINGRVASLLEVGTGFHPELSGRENIYLNGAILGMSKKEIEAKFDNIVEFSGCEKFLDTPVKRYSSGMRVRLGFAVAAHLESEILIVDEVLAVGDAEFQKKCLGKMDEISKGEGRTIIFVSHNMSAVQSLCDKGVVLDKGEVKFVGDIKDAIKVYSEQNRKDKTCIEKRNSGDIELVEFEDLKEISSGDEFRFEFCLKEINNFNNLMLNFGLFNETGDCIVHYDSSGVQSKKVNKDKNGNFKFEIVIDSLCIPESYYTMGIQIRDSITGIVLWLDDIPCVRVVEQRIYTGNQACVDVECKIEV